MSNEREEKLKELRTANEEFQNTPGTNTPCKKGQAKEKFDKLANASGKCWDEVQSDKLTPEERRKFFEEFKEELRKTGK